jgi:hypothetical protein
LVQFKLSDKEQFSNCGNDGVGMFEGKVVSNYGCLIAKSVHNLNVEFLFCNIMNTSDSHVRFKDNGVVGRITS